MEINQFKHIIGQIQIVEKKSLSAKSKMIKNRSKCQRDQFDLWAEKQSWSTFHQSIFDQWAFPVDEEGPNLQKYLITKKELQQLGLDDEFLRILKQNATLVCKSWGFNLATGKCIKTKNIQQKWQNFPIRLYKITRSLQLFQLRNEHKQACRYASSLIQMGWKFKYASKDFSKYFLSFIKNKKYSSDEFEKFNAVNTLLLKKGDSYTQTLTSNRQKQRETQDNFEDSESLNNFKSNKSKNQNQFAKSVEFSDKSEKDGKDNGQKLQILKQQDHSYHSD